MEAPATPPDWLTGYYEGYEPSLLFEQVPATTVYGPSLADLRRWRDADPAWFDEAVKSIYAEEAT